MKPVFLCLQCGCECEGIGSVERHRRERHTPRAAVNRWKRIPRGAKLQPYYYRHAKGFRVDVWYICHREFRTSDMLCRCSVLMVNGLYLARLTWFGSGAKGSEPVPVFDCSELETTYELAVSKLEPYMTLSSELGLPLVPELLKTVKDGCQTNPGGVKVPDSTYFPLSLELSRWYWKKSTWKYLYG